MADPTSDSPTKTESVLHQMLTSIAAERKKSHIGPSDSGFELVTATMYMFWTEMFMRYFAGGSLSPDDTRDDMLFYIRKNPELRNKFGMIRPLMEVYRRDSKHLPQLDDPLIDWEETVYLNIIMHQFDYHVTCAVCTRTSVTDLQILRKCTHRVYASPSQREMDSKGTHEKIMYPSIFFTIDAFEEHLESTKGDILIVIGPACPQFSEDIAIVLERKAFEELIVRDSEFVAVELTASDKQGSFQSVLFIGSVKYEALKQTYDSRTSVTSKMMQRMSFGWYKDKRRVEFMRMRGPRGKGHAEMAVSRVKGSGPETPCGENFPITDFENDEQNQYTQRRMSDPSASSGARFPGGFRRATSMKKSRSETEKVDNSSETASDEVEAGTLQDELDEEEPQNGILSGWSFSQAWHNFKERRRASSVALHANLTYVTLPWHHIIADLLENRAQPVLTH